MEFVLRLQKQRAFHKKQNDVHDHDYESTFDDDTVKSDTEVHRKATVRKKYTKVR